MITYKHMIQSHLLQCLTFGDKVMVVHASQLETTITSASSVVVIPMSSHSVHIMNPQIKWPLHPIKHQITTDSFQLVKAMVKVSN